jgi:sugar fermentation stimulation protein A
MRRSALSDSWKEALFLERPNRFTLMLRSGKDVIAAYLPNTGRLEEYLVKDHPFYVIPSRSPKFRFRVVSTLYQGSYVLLDTIEMNNLAEHLIRGGLIQGLSDVTSVVRERTMGRSRFDFVVERRTLKPLIIEVKTCTLSHNGVAMFPDAPTERARSHIEHMAGLQRGGYDAAMFFIIPNASTRRFLPNVHTDPDFYRTMKGNRRIQFRAFRVGMTDPVSVQLDSAEEIPVRLDLLDGMDLNRGTYLLIMENPLDKRVKVGALGDVDFPRGYYAYVGSGMGSLESRVRRHFRTRKKRFWHIDYVTPHHLKPIRQYLIRRADRIESALAVALSDIASRCIRGFGSTDSSAASHLFHFDHAPFRDRRFMDLLLSYRTMTET